MADLDPGFEGSRFRCPHCGVLAQQRWAWRLVGGGRNAPSDTVFEVPAHTIAKCELCEKPSIWVRTTKGGSMVYPANSLGEPPVGSMPDSVKTVYEEARRVSSHSPRAACALLRVALEQLSIELGAKGADLNERIGDLVRRGIPEKVQQALDATRVCGNDAVHPETLVLDDTREDARLLFEILNYITDVLVGGHQKIDALYNRLPSSKRKGIADRDT